MSAPLSACSKCYSRQPFDELSQGQQLCKECRGSFPIVKCTYCRSEFQQGSKSSTAAVCKKCESMVKEYGKPSACDYCNVIASFIGKKCARCTNAEKKYGPPTTCEQCKQKCAFDRKDDDKKKVDGKVLCWLCTLSYKRALARTKVTDPGRNSRVKLTSNASQHKEKQNRARLSGHNKRPNRPDVTKLPLEESPAKVAKVVRAPPPKVEDANSSEQMALTSQLREQISRLEKQLKEKKTQLLDKDRQIHDMRADHFTMAQEERIKTRNIQREFDAKLEKLQLKIRDQNKEIAQLSKGKRKSKGPEGKISEKDEPEPEQDTETEPVGGPSAVSSATEGGSSGTDSPSVS